MPFGEPVGEPIRPAVALPPPAGLLSPYGVPFSALVGALYAPRPLPSPFGNSPNKSAGVTSCTDARADLLPSEKKLSHKRMPPITATCSADATTKFLRNLVSTALISVQVLADSPPVSSARCG